MLYPPLLWLLLVVDDSVNTLRQRPQPRPAFRVAPCPAPHPSCPRPSVQPPISAGIIANTVIRLNIAELRAHGIRETN